MRIVLDTNVLVSALISPDGLPDRLFQFWEADEFSLVTSDEQLFELDRVLGYKKLQRFIRPEQSKQLVSTLRKFAIFARDLPGGVCGSPRHRLTFPFRVPHQVAAQWSGWRAGIPGRT